MLQCFFFQVVFQQEYQISAFKPVQAILISILYLSYDVETKPTRMGSTVEPEPGKTPPLQQLDEVQGALRTSGWQQGCL